MPTWRIGTSGFAYDDWRGRFYPPDLPRRRWLEFYQQEFPVVELNVSFYRTPKESTYQGWNAATRPDFRFVLKAPGSRWPQLAPHRIALDVHRGL